MQRIPPIISVSNLIQRLQVRATDIKILDATLHIMPDQIHRDAAEEYTKTHILDADFFAVKDCRDKSSPYEYMLPSESEFADYVGDKGIDNNTHVVIYDTYNGFASAPRTWWMFRVFGYDRVSILDGGLAKWMKVGLPTSDRKIETTRKRFHAEFQPHLYKTYDEMVGNMQSGEFQVIDVRPTPQFFNVEDNGHLSNIPGSHHSPLEAFLHDSESKDQGLKGSFDILEEFQKADIDLSLPLVATCLRGIRACSVALAAARLGKNDVAVYDGSWQEFRARMNEDGEE